MEGFQSKNGLFFKRNDGDSSVVVAATGPNVTRLESTEWAHVVASMTQEGENSQTYHDAFIAQTGGIDTA